MKVVLILFLVIVVSALSCSGNKDHGILTYHLVRSDYIEKLRVTGTIQAVVNYPVMPPPGYFGLITVKRLAADGAFVKKGDTICVLTAPELESGFKAINSSLDSLEAGLKKAEADNKLNIALLEAQLAISEAQLKISSLDSLQIKYATEVQGKLLVLDMKKSLIEKEKTEKKLIATKLIGETNIKQINARIIQERSKEQSMAAQVKSLIIIAQREGVVMRTESPRFSIMGPEGSGTMGGPIKEGSVIFMDIPVLQFPDLDKMQVSAEVAEADFKKLEKDQHVLLSIEAANELTTTGVVNRKNLIGHFEQRYSDSKVKFYEVIIDIDSCYSRMKPGLSALCEIIITQVKDTLFVPTLAVFLRDSSKVVYVKKKNQFIPVRVQTGISGSSYTIISGALKGDEIIALSEPPGSLIASGLKR